MLKKETLQEHIYKDILLRIYEGELPDGSSLPTLKELGRQYQAGDNCIRAVIVRLRENGYLSTKRGRPARIVCRLHEEAAGGPLPSSFSYDKKKLHSFYEVIHILFPSIYTYASMACSQAQLEELNRIVALLPSGEDACSDYVELNIRFFKTIHSSFQNDLILQIVQTVMHNTVLPAAWIQRERIQLAEEFLQGCAAMRRLYAGITEKNPACIKRQWQQLFQIAETMVLKAAPGSQELPIQGFNELADFRFVEECKYMLIAHNLYDKILEGVYPVGTFLPAISEACRLYDAAKVTIQAAYGVLADIGIIKTMHGRGSMVMQLTFGSIPSFDEEASSAKRAEYLDTIEFLQIVCEDILLHSQSPSFQPLRNRLEGGLNPSHRYSTLILCRYLMKNACAPALDTFYQLISRKLYWGIYLSEATERISLAEKHCLCMAIADALEQRRTGLAIARTKELLAALYQNA